MASLNDAFTIARSGVLTHQERLAVISHNIANVNTPGYHRQQATLATNPPNEPNFYYQRNYSIGTGVHVADIVRMHDAMKERVYLDQSSDLEQHMQLAGTLGDVEALLNGMGDGSLSTRLEEFWSGWQDLANNADRIAFRTTVAERGVALAGQFNTLAEMLSTYRSAIAEGGSGPDFTGQAPNLTGNINRIAAQIQTLNQRLASPTGPSSGSNDLMDRRDLLIRDLASLANVSVGADYTVRIDGQLLVSGDGGTCNTLAMANTDTVPMEFTLDGAAVSITGGKLGGLVSAAGEIDAIQAKLDILANELIAQVNTLHQSGYDLDGNPGIEFFTGAGAMGIQVNTLIVDPANPLLDNPRLIAAAATVHDPGPPVVANVRDGAHALQIADLGRLPMPALGNQTFGDYFGATLSDLGAQIDVESDYAADGQAVVDMLDAAIQSADGVNLDEELMEMINAQRAYQASSRMITTLDGMMDVVINRMGA